MERVPLIEFYRLKELTDVELIQDGVSYHAHKVVVASCSQFLRKLFTSDFVEARKSQITLDKLFPSIVEYMYTGAITITASNVVGLLSHAHQLLIDPLIRSCEAFLASHLTADTALAVVREGEQFQEPTSRIRATHLLAEQFNSLRSGSQLSGLSWEVLLACLEDPLLQVWDEWDVYRFVDALAQRSEKEGGEGAAERTRQLYGTVRWPYLAVAQLREAESNPRVPRELVKDGYRERLSLWERPRVFGVERYPFRSSYLQNVAVSGNSGKVGWTVVSPWRPAYSLLTSTPPLCGNTLGIGSSQPFVSGNVAGEGVRVTLGGGMGLRPTGYGFSHGHTSSDYFLRSWDIFGSQDGSHWDLIRSHKDDPTVKSRDQFYAWSLEPKEGKEFPFYSFFKIVSTGPNSHGSQELCVTNLRFFGTCRFTSP